MAIRYCWSGATGTGTGASWANAFTDLATALTGTSAGDTIYIASDHSETSTTSFSPTAGGSDNSPVLIISVNRAGSVPPVSADILAGASVTRSSAANINFNASCRSVGVNYTISGTGTFTQSGASHWYFRNCTITLGSSSNGFNLGSSSSNPGATDFDNVTVSYGGATPTIRCINGILRWKGGGIAGSPTNLFSATSINGAAFAFIEGIDISAVTTPINVWNNASRVHFRDCKVNNSLAGPSITYAAAAILYDNCDSTTGNTNYRFARYYEQGSLLSETTIVRSGGATDGTTPRSVKATTSGGPGSCNPLRVEMDKWIDSTGSAVTLSVELVNDGTTLTNAQVWLEVMALDSTTSPQSSVHSSAPADELAAASNLTTSTVTWTTTGLTTPIKQVVSVTFTPRKKGWHHIVLNIAGPTTKTVYVDPMAHT